MRRNMTKKIASHSELQHVHSIVARMREDRAVTPFPASFPSVDAYVPVYTSPTPTDDKYWLLDDIRRR
jgi:hypothetical protein